MCGLFGLIDLDRNPIDRERAARMLEVMHHRGPDGCGYYQEDHLFLGHRRLSIIDVEGGSQPLYNEAETVAFIGNGEIYNHEELRDELVAKGHTFRTRSDNEVVVHLYEEEGERCLNRMNGMFAFALFDRKAGSLLIARDRIGIKPLYYSCDGRLFIFSSEMKAIIESGLIPLSVNDDVVYQYLTLHHSIPPSTLIRGIRSLAPGHYLSVTDRPTEQIQYWDIDSNVDGDTLPYGEALERFEHLLEDSVRKRLMSDVPLGLFLSGGIDSSMIAVMMEKIGVAGIKTFSIGFREEQYSELPYSRRVSDMISSDHTEIIVTADDIMEHIERVIWFRETPISEVSDIPIFLLSRAAARDVKVVLTGEGGDEVFGGYNKYIFERLAGYTGVLTAPVIRGMIGSDIVKRMMPQRLETAIELLSEKDRFRRYYQWFGFFRDDELRTMLRPERMELLSGPDAYRDVLGDRRFRSNIDEMQYLDVKVWLPDNLLLRGDRMSMASSIEARVPFLDHRLVELSYRLPDRYKVRRGVAKFLLKKIGEKYLSRDMVYRKKIGFEVPVGRWFKDELKDCLTGNLLKSNSFCGEYLRRESIERLITDHIEGRKDNRKKLWMLLNLEMWHERFIGCRAR
jgi:asparagine synthase (glutamine-hydrolysing)